MTVRTPPTFLQDGQHPAENTRLMTHGLFGSSSVSFAGGVGALDPGHGVARLGDLAVTQNGTPNMSVDVAAGGAFIRGTESTSQGVYHFYNDATVNLSIDASDPTNARRDLIVAQVRDAGYSGSDNDARLLVVKGTAAGSPVDPTVPANCLVLARVSVAAASTSVVTANITDTRTVARPWNTAWGVVASGVDTVRRNSRSTSAAISSDLTVSFVAPADRRYKITGQVAASGSTFANHEVWVYAGSSSVGRTAYQTYSSSLLVHYLVGSLLNTPAGGTVTYNLRLSTSAGTVDARNDAIPGRLIVEDVGPA